jgi:polyisoprenyl-phosphate glycosyltransferase
MSRPTLSLVLPIYNEEEIIPELGRRLTAFFADIDRNGVAPRPPRDTSAAAGERASAVGEAWEVIFVNDGSADRSMALLTELAAREARYKVLSFARNFGHQMAITAGIDRAEGDAVVVMDADLQDPPEVVSEMLVRWRDGFDVVYAVRSKRHGESWFKRSTAALFYRLLRAMLGGVSIPADAGDFRLMGRPVVLTLRALREQHRFVRGMVAWVGFRQTAVTYERPARFAGETKYPFRKMLRFAVDGITSFSTVPLRIAIWLGVVAGCVALAGGVWAIYVKLFGQGVVPGWTTIMILVSGGSSAQLLMTGILGEYVGRIYEEVKRRPLYVVRDEINLGPHARVASAAGAPVGTTTPAAAAVPAPTAAAAAAGGPRHPSPSDS